MQKRIYTLLLAVITTLSLLPVTALAEDSGVPFSASAGDLPLAAVRSETDYTYTEVLEYDESWNPVRTEDCTADLYVVTVPADIDTVTLDFGDAPRLAYGYDVNGQYTASYGDYGDNGTIGQTTASVSGLPAFVRVQTPYVEGTSTLLYAVTFQTEGGEPETPESPAGEPDMDTLLTTIAAGYVHDSSQWVVMDMGAYGRLVPSAASKTSAAARQAYIDAAIASIAGGSATEGDCFKAILNLRAVGVDPQVLYPAGSSVPVSAVAALKALGTYSASAWSAPYTLAAFNQGDYGTDDAERTLLDAVLANQGEDGSWTEWGDSIQTTANMLAGLAFYCGTDADVTTAVDKAVSYLSTAQKSDGTFDAYGYGADANTAATVVIGLAAVGIDPDTDPRFIKNGTSALDGLLAFACADNRGFWYGEPGPANSYATEQGFRALIAASGVAAAGEAFQVYDFSGNPAIPAHATSHSSETPEAPDDTIQYPINVSFTLKTHESTWIRRHTVTVEDGSTVADVFYQVLDARDDFSYMDEGGYISSITYDDTTWGEFDAGPNSGWKYMVNGVAPSAGMNDKVLEDGDALVWYYVTDYTQDTDRDEEQFEPEAPIPPVVPVLSLPPMAFADLEGHWAADAIQYVYERGLMSGVTAESFSPETPVSRGMIAAILYCLDGSPAGSGTASFTDVAADVYYADAVAWAAANGIASGYDDGAFGPNDPVTRAQLAVILYRYARYRGYDVSAAADLNAFTDAGDIRPWAQDALAWANANALVNGGENGALAPQNGATRAQTAVILMRYLENIIK